MKGLKVSKVFQPQPIEVYESWIEALDESFKEHDSEPSAWECDFLASLTERLERKVNLTERQAEILERIYTEKTK